MEVIEVEEVRLLCLEDEVENDSVDDKPEGSSGHLEAVEDR
jgi:hypothetical protein